MHSDPVSRSDSYQTSHTCCWMPSVRSITIIPPKLIHNRNRVWCVRQLCIVRETAFEFAIGYRIHMKYKPLNYRLCVSQIRWRLSLLITLSYLQIFRFYFYSRMLPNLHTPIRFGALIMYPVSPLMYSLPKILLCLRRCHPASLGIWVA